jgi:2,4-dienoyl-CoA reductase-like NADH-dependent reductase (Old Yellow Enzyme family)
MLRADSPLFKPVQIGNVLLPNRFMRSATWEGGSDDSGAPQPPLLSMISKLAREEVGLVVPGFVYPLRAGQAVPNQTGVNSARLCDAWRPTIAEIHRTTFSKIAFQIGYAGHADSVRGLARCRPRRWRMSSSRSSPPPRG